MNKEDAIKRLMILGIYVIIFGLLLGAYRKLEVISSLQSDISELKTESERYAALESQTNTTIAEDISANAVATARGYTIDADDERVINKFARDIFNFSSCSEYASGRSELHDDMGISYDSAFMIENMPYLDCSVLNPIDINKTVSSLTGVDMFLIESDADSRTYFVKPEAEVSGYLGFTKKSNKTVFILTVSDGVILDIETYNDMD